jgi:hypothetical protein
VSAALGAKWMAARQAWARMRTFEHRDGGVLYHYAAQDEGHVLVLHGRNLRRRAR